MEKGKKLIRIVYYTFKWLLNINIVLGLGIIGVQILNLIIPKFNFAFSYLGKYQFTIEKAFYSDSLNVFVQNVSGTPMIITDLPAHKWMVFIYSIIAVSASIGFNYLIFKLFKSLNNSAKSNSAFTEDIKKHLSHISYLAFFVFAAGIIFNAVKIVSLPAMRYEEFVMKPVFDNSVWNFLWVGLGFYILKEIYQVGVELKKDQDLTI